MRSTISIITIAIMLLIPVSSRAGVTPTAITIIAAEAKTTAETYWRAQKISDHDLFRSVTPHDRMRVVFGWAFVRETPVKREDGEIAEIREDLKENIALNRKRDADAKIQRADKGYIKALERMAAASKKASEHANKIGATHPMLGELLQKSFAETIMPGNFAGATNYSLLTYEYLADVEFQSKAGTTIKRRVTTMLRRLIVGTHDSGWKVFFIPGAGGF